MSFTDELLANNAAYARTFEAGGLPARPRRSLTVVTCMDARLDLFAALGLRTGDSHMIRNSGGVVTDDTIRSLAISQRMLGTTAVVLVHHTDCGMLRFTDAELKRTIRTEVGIAPDWDSEAFDDVDESVRRSLDRVRSSPFIPHRDAVRGFVYDVATGALREVT